MRPRPSGWRTGEGSPRGSTVPSVTGRLLLVVGVVLAVSGTG
ncbi:hypothetical protein JD79_03459 [Geodermatophilus normandii]|uniref:Uncharacterized protein n=1 Tax=Geodermatophilus normandii TaxID=1137989 RepID=A0A317QRE9_9ACTN|nr:hypothetical protein JD79_03459 [Geodermatophilus normandii]